jgi:hypothetical protein
LQRIKSVITKKTVSGKATATPHKKSDMHRATDTAYKMLIIPHSHPLQSQKHLSTKQFLERATVQHASLQQSPIRGQVQGPCNPHDKYLSAPRPVLTLAFAAFGGILYGYDTGTISGIIAMPAWLKIYGTIGIGTATAENPDAYGITSSTTSLVVSILSAGTFFGALAAYPVGDIIGRKYLT